MRGKLFATSALLALAASFWVPGGVHGGNPVARRTTASRLAELQTRIARSVAAINPGFLTRTHSHNDYEQREPLLLALANRFYSVEADLWLSGGEIRVSHLPWNYVGTLAELYLEPLQKLVTERGSVYGDGRPFYLWLDLKEGGEPFRHLLANVLEHFPMLRGPKPAVTVVLTGDEEGKTKFFTENETSGFEIPVLRDSNVYTAEDPTGKSADPWSWYSLRWGDFFRWNGKGAMPDCERKHLHELVSSIHAKGRKVRFYGAPEGELYWALSLEENVDLIGTDEIEGLGSYLLQSPISL